MGYRDPEQLRIRDESQLARQRTLGIRARPTISAIQEPLEDMARAAFFSHYVMGFSKTFDVLERIGRQSVLDKHLSASVDAVSLAFFSFQHSTVAGPKIARQKYLSALPLIHNALATPEYIASDSTLLAVLFLDLYEKISNRSPISSEAWMSHVRGAMALLRLRDPVQLKTYVGLRLSVRLFTNMLISCVAADCPVPQALIDLHSDLQSYVDQDDPKWQVSSLVMKYSTFRGAVENDLLTSSELLNRAKKLDSEFSSLARKLPPSWIYRRIPLMKHSSRVLDEYYDVYPDYFTAQTCNVIRIIRILLNDLIRSRYLDAISASDNRDRYSLDVQFATHVIDTLAREICATGPQFTGVNDVPSKHNHSSPVRRIHCYTLLFPFYVAGFYASSGSQIREWVIQQLRHISTDSGMRNAAAVAEMLNIQNSISPWSVYAMLGSYAFAA